VNFCGVDCSPNQFHIGNSCNKFMQLSGVVHNPFVIVCIWHRYLIRFLPLFYSSALLEHQAAMFICLVWLAERLLSCKPIFYKDFLLPGISSYMSASLIRYS